MRAIITATGHYVPPNILTNHDLEKMVDTNDEWITSRTGIKERRILDKDKGTSYMAVRAARMALEQRQMAADQLDLIIVATVTPDAPVPSTAALVQRELKADNCWGYDLNGGCTGFVFALATGAQFISSGLYKKILVIGADKMSSIIDYEDRNTCILFGDAAGAVILETSADDSLGIEDFTLHLDGTGSKSLYMSGGGSLKPASLETVNQKLHYLYQDGRTVYKYAVTGMADASAQILERNHLSGSDIKLMIPHQANARIIEAVATKLKLEKSQLVVNIAKYGNTTAATIPLALSEAHQAKRMTVGDRILIAAFGAGFAWGSLILKWALD
jgi:3-oxoacyl-[acyl-carrier-protein] synthase-3